MRMISQHKKMMVVLVVLLFGVFVWTLPAGNLNPPGAPASTMKTLDEVEPRIPIPASESPTGAVSIYDSGSYYLTGDRYCSGSGILVYANDVTIDLMGYKLVGPDSGTNYGIDIGGRTNIEIRNGTIREFSVGIHEDSNSGLYFRILQVRCIANTLHGIYLLGQSHLIKDCMVVDNGQAAADIVYGIYAPSGSSVTGNIVRNNGHSATGDTVYGIRSFYGCTLTDNTVHYNGPYATSTVYGIYANNGNVVTGNNVRYSGHYADGSAYGIYASTGCTVTGNTAYYNGYHATGDVIGIRLGSYNLVDQNATYFNGTGAGSSLNMDLTIGSCVYGNNVAP